MFGTSIFENILYGLADHGLDKMSEKEQREKVVKACKVANAHEFILKLPKVRWLFSNLSSLELKNNRDMTLLWETAGPLSLGGRSNDWL